MEQELKEQVNQILQKNLDEVYFSVAEKILNDHPKSRYLPWMLAHKMSPEEARVIDALPDKDWTPEVGELKVSKSFAEKLGMDKYEIDAQIMDRFFSADVMSDPEQGPVIRPDPVQWMDLQHSPVWRERNGHAYYIVLQLFLEDELAPRMEAETKAAKVGSGKLKVSWKQAEINTDYVTKQSGKTATVSGYQIVCATDKKFSKNVVKTTVSGESLSKTVTGLKNDKTYYVKVRAYKTVNGKKLYGLYSSVRKQKV